MLCELCIGYVAELLGAVPLGGIKPIAALRALCGAACGHCEALGLALLLVQKEEEGAKSWV